MNNSTSSAFCAVQAFGAGVQSVAMLHMAIRNQIARPDLVIFADTGGEPEHVYRVVKESKAACDEASMEFCVVDNGDLADFMARKGQLRVPLFTLAPDGSKGMLFRTCTDKHKIVPIRRELRRRGVTKAEMWMGITVDEIQRVKPSSVKWIANRYPFIDLNLRRSDCEAFLARHGIVAAKSACVYCPYRSAAMWRAVRDVPADWEAAIAYDESIRDARPGLKSFCHVSRTPLVNAVFEAEPGLFDDECLGMCAA